MALASTSSLQIAYIQESTFGVVPVAGTPKSLRITGESLSFDVSKEVSKEIEASRSISSVVPVNASASGALNAEISYAEYDPLLASVFQSTFSAYGTNGVGSTFTADFASGTITASVAPTGNNAFTNLKKGQWFRVSAGANTNHGKILRVSTVTAPTSTVITLDTNTPATASAAVANVSLQTSRLTHGTTQTSWSIERNSADIGEFFLYTGMTPSKVTINIASGSISTMSFDFMGKAASSDTSTMLPNAPSASQSYEIHSGVGGATSAVWLDGVPITGTYVKSASISFDNTLRAQSAVGTLGSVAIGSGTIACTAQLQVYFADSSLFNYFVDNTNTSLIFSSTDNLGNGYIFSIPKANITSYKTNGGGKDQDMMLDLSVTCLRDAANADSALRKLIFIDRIGDAVA